VLEEVLTHQAVCLAELGEVTMAMDLARSALAADRYPRRYGVSKTNEEDVHA